MTDQQPTGSFDDVLGSPAATEAAEPVARKPGWLYPTLTAVLALAGAAVLFLAVLTPPGESAAAPAATETAEAPADGEATPAPTVTLGAGSGAALADIEDMPISELADADWLEETAEATDIPERALAAYAGAALSVARTNPECGIGWNTIAAIGFVETEHGSMNGATIGEDGVVSPTIIGVPLDGGDVAEVPDTDGGELDGDAEWDRAVGPMQFIPSTWATERRDGNKDGEKDVNQIDDAALAAAEHLCEIGGDLTVAENWITAIAAYNDSVDYNNRVAEAATAYAEAVA